MSKTAAINRVWSGRPCHVQKLGASRFYGNVCVMRWMFRFAAPAAVPALLLTILIGLTPAVSPAQPRHAAGDNLVTMNFDDVDISVLAKFISQITGKNFVFDDDVSGRVSVVAPGKVTPAQAYCIFLSALQLKGFAAIEAGPVIRILPAREARAIARVTNSQTPAGECAQPIDSGRTTAAPPNAGE
jgi:type II secretory pathway component HofQ